MQTVTEIALHPDDTIDVVFPQGLFGGLYRVKYDRLEIIRVTKGGANITGFAVRTFDHETDTDVFRIQRYTVAEQKQHDDRQDKRNGDAGWVTQYLQAFLAHHAAKTPA